MPASPDLTDREIEELDDLLAQTPEPLQPLDVVMLDGYLCGVLVQPRLIDAAEWLPPIFDFDGASLPETVDPAWRARCETLIRRRHEALNAALVEDGWFDPLVMELSEEDAAEVPPDLRELGLISLSMMPWVGGFQQAAVCFPELAEMPDDAVMTALARLYRHLPAETDEDREVRATLDREQPLATLDDAIEEVVLAIADLVDLTHDRRYHVETVRRDPGKVGRNEPCPCGSGKKYKQCHGAN